MLVISAVLSDASLLNKFISIFVIFCKGNLILQIIDNKNRLFNLSFFRF
jgi:hypothetical protein